MKTTNKITVLVRLNILPGYEKDIREAAEKIWLATRQEKGNETFVFNTLADNDNVLLFFEIFRSQKDFDFHLQASHTLLFLDLLKGKVAGDGPELTFLNQFED